MRWSQLSLKKNLAQHFQAYREPHHNVDGVLVSYGDTIGLATAMGELIKDQALGERLSRTALEKAKERYHEDAYKKDLCRIVNSVSTGHAASD